MTRSGGPTGGGSRSDGIDGVDRHRAVDDTVHDVRADESPGTLTSAFRGGTGGLVATVVMTLFRVPVFRALPPTSEFWAQYVGGGSAEEHTAEGLVLHLLYGAVGGTVLGVLFPYVDRRSPARTQVNALLAGSVYGCVLSAVGDRVVFRHLLDRELDEEHVVVFYAAHVVYGLTLGMWLGERKRRGEAYESPERDASSETAPARGG